MQQEISLYIALAPSTKIDLEAAARAAIAFNSFVKEVAFAVDPFSIVRVELESGTEGSLALNSVIRGISGLMTPRALKAIAAGVLLFFGHETASYTYAKALDYFLASGETQTSAEELAAHLQRIFEAKNTEKEARKVYQELQRDDAVTGVGVSITHGVRPEFVVPRSEFSDRGREIKQVEDETVRFVTTVQSLTLVSPVLVKSKRKWKFKQGKFEFGAPVLDERFLDRVFSGREPILMSDGITMKVRITTKEQRKDGVVWEIIDRQIEEVLEVIPPPQQTHFLMTPEDTKRD
jgi:hypothetical protein